MTEAREELLRQIIAQRKELTELRIRADELRKKKQDAEEHANNLKELSATDQPLQHESTSSITGERVFDLRKVFQDEETVKSGLAEKIVQTVQNRNELMKRIEAESSFLSNNLKKRTSKQNTEIHQLRTDLLAISRRLLADLTGVADPEISSQVEQLNTEVESAITKLKETRQKVVDLDNKGWRLCGAMDKLMQQKGKNGPPPGQEKRRRSAFAVPKVHVVKKHRI